MSSQIVQEILNSTNPLPINTSEDDVTEVNGVRGVILNKSETENIPDIDQYELNNDSNPELIKKKPCGCVQYKQEVDIKFLKSTARPPSPGKIIIRQEPDYYAPALPPVVVRVNSERPPTPPPVVIREEPPKQPPPIPEKIITIPGREIQQPRRIIIEKLPPEPPRPQSVIIEKWLAPERPKRTVIFERVCQPSAPSQQKNVIVEWEQPCVQVETEVKNLGTLLADPDEYRSKYQFNKKPNDLPPFIKDNEKISLIQPDNELLPELVGDIEALRFVDLEKEGLGEYKTLIESLVTKQKSTQVYTKSTVQSVQSAPSPIVSSSLSFQPQRVETSVCNQGNASSKSYISSNVPPSYSVSGVPAATTKFGLNGSLPPVQPSKPCAPKPVQCQQAAPQPVVSQKPCGQPAKTSTPAITPATTPSPGIASRSTSSWFSSTSTLAKSSSYLTSDVPPSYSIQVSQPASKNIPTKQYTQQSSNTSSYTAAYSAATPNSYNSSFFSSSSTATRPQSTLKQATSSLFFISS